MKLNGDWSMHKTRLLFVLFGISLAIRLAVAIPVAVAEMPPRGDEGGYVKRATGFQEYYEHALQGQFDELPSDVKKLYGSGRWGPFYPYVLSIAFIVFGQSLMVARLVVALVSALTTPLVYLLTDRLSGHRAALVAAGFHLLYVRFIAFAHLLWSETFFIFLVLLAIYLASRLTGAVAARKQLPLAIAAGIVLGLGGLTRPTILPFLFLVPLWVGLNVRGTRARLVLPAAVVLAWMLTLSPWQALMIQREGHFVFLTTTGSLNLFRGNTPEGLNDRQIRADAEERGLDPDAVLRNLAVEEIARDPQAFVKRGLDQVLRRLWAVDGHVFKHLRRGIYPPLPHAVVAIWFVVALLTYLALVTFAGFGFQLQARPLNSMGNLLLALVLSNLAFPLLVAGGNLRLTLVNLALMLPVAGHGAANLGRFRDLKYKAIVVALCLLMPVAILRNLPKRYSDSTSYYAPLLSQYHSLFGNRTEVVDQVLVRTTDVYDGQRLRFSVLDGAYRIDELELIDKDYYLAHDSDQTAVDWVVSEEQREIRLVVYADDADAPAQLEIVSEQAARSVYITPVNRESWQSWQPTGLDGVEYYWLPMTQTVPPAM